MQAENAKHAAEMLKRSGELAGTAAEILAGGAAGEAVQQLLEQAQNLASSALELLGQYTAQKTPRKHSLLRKAAGAAILTGTALYLVPEWRRTVEDAVKVVADNLRCQFPWPCSHRAGQRATARHSAPTPT